jgi:hypothetical protein
MDNRAWTIPTDRHFGLSLADFRDSFLLPWKQFRNPCNDAAEMASMTVVAVCWFLSFASWSNDDVYIVRSSFGKAGQCKYSECKIVAAVHLDIDFL